MSRIGKQPIILNSQVDIGLDGNTVSIEGPKGKLEYDLPDKIKLEIQGEQLVLSIKKNSKDARALHGLARTIVNNMVTGVSRGFCKMLEIQGVGYRAQIDNKKNLILNVGYSHPIYMTTPSGISLEVNNNTEISVQGVNKERVGHFAAQIRSKRPPEPYKGKGIRYKNEIIRKKVGKAGK